MRWEVSGNVRFAFISISREQSSGRHAAGRAAKGTELGRAYATTVDLCCAGVGRMLQGLTRNFEAADSVVDMVRRDPLPR